MYIYVCILAHGGQSGCQVLWSWDLWHLSVAWCDNFILVPWKNSVLIGLLLVCFCQPDTKGRVIWQERTPVEKMSLPDCPVGKPVVSFLDWWLIWEGLTHCATCWMVVADEMVQLGKVLVPCYLSLVPGTHIRKDRSDTLDQKLSLISTHMLWHLCPHTYTQSVA